MSVAGNDPQEVQGEIKCKPEGLTKLQKLVLSELTKHNTTAEFCGGAKERKFYKVQLKLALCEHETDEGIGNLCAIKGIAELWCGISNTS